MDKLACVVFVAKLKAPKEQPEIYSSMSSLLQLLNQIDDKEEFFSKHFLPIYLSLIHDYYQSQSVAQLSKLPLEEYLFWAKKEIIQEKQFCEKHFQRKKGQQAIEQIVKCIFDDCYLAHKQRIYSSDEHKLFVELTLPLL